MASGFGTDDPYVVECNKKLKGYPAGVFQGQKGTFSASKIIKKDTLWEPGDLNL